MAGKNVFYGKEGGATVTSTIDGLLKEHYVMKNITDTVNMQTYFLSRLTTEKTQFGRRFVFPLRFAVGQGQGNRRENEKLPDPGFGEYDQASGNVRYQYGTMYITGPAIESTSGSVAAFKSSLKAAMKDLRDGFKLETHYQSWGGEDGIIAKVNGEHTAKTEISVKDPYGISYTNSTLSAAEKHVLFHRGMNLVFGSTNIQRQVVGKKTNGNIVLNADTTLADNDVIARGDSATLHSKGKNYLGMADIFKQTGTYLNVPRDNEPNWTTNELDLGGNALSEDYLQQAFDTAEIFGNGMINPNMLISNHKVRRLYVSLLEGRKRYVKPMNLQGGYKALEYNGEPWVVDKLCPPERIYYMDTREICWFYMKRIGWLQKDGSVLKWVDEMDAWRCVLATYRNFACKLPANQTVMTNVVK